MGGIREAIEAATAQLEEEDGDLSNDGGNDQSGSNLPAGTDKSDDDEPGPGEKPAEPAGEKEPAGDKKTEGADDKAKPAEGEAAKPGEKKPAEGKPAAEPQKSSTVKPPISWKPAIREKFGALPPEVQEEITRREREMDVGMRQTAEARHFKQEFDTIVNPYLATIQAEGGTPIQAVQSLFNTAYTLRVGMPQQKARIAAQMIMQFGIDVQMVDEMLAAMVQGRAPALDPVVQEVERRMAPVTKFMQEMQRTRESHLQSTDQQLTSELTAFVNDPKNEFWEDVKSDVADILELAAQRNQKMTLQEAYNKATMLHPEIAAVIQGRQAAEAAAQRTQQAKKAKKTGASVPGGALPAGGNDPAATKDRRSALEAAWDKVVGERG